MQKISERSLFFIVGIVLLFLLLNFNFQLGTVYLFFLSFSFILFLTDKEKTIKLERRTDNRWQALFVGVGSYVIFLIVMNIITTKFFGQSFALNDMAKLFAQFTTPAFTGNKYLAILAWGFLIPLIETKTFFGRVYEEICDAFKANPYKITTITFLAIAGIIALFVSFHSTSFGIGNTIGLISVGVFALFSMGLVLIFKELKQATIFHITANLYGMGLLGALILC